MKLCFENFFCFISLKFQAQVLPSVPNFAVPCKLYQLRSCVEVRAESVSY